MSRPAWASGDEWGGWRYRTQLPDSPVIRSFVDGRSEICYIEIDKNGSYTLYEGLGVGGCSATVRCESLALALIAANALAEACGGWS